MRSSLLVLLVVARVAAADPVPQYSIWVGSYVCSQGLTHLRLTIETKQGGGAAFGHFEFGPHESNKSVPNGHYWMKGSMRAGADGRLEVVLRPERWALQPKGYVMVGLTATTDREQHTLAGHIDYPGCTTLSVERVGAEAAN